MANIFERLLGRKSKKNEASKTAPAREKLAPMIDQENVLDPMLAKRLTELESTMAGMAKAHSYALKEQATLRLEIDRLKKPEAPAPAQAMVDEEPQASTAPEINQ